MQRILNNFNYNLNKILFVPTREGIKLIKLIIIKSNFILLK